MQKDKQHYKKDKAKTTNSYIFPAVLGLDDKAQDEELTLAAHTSTSTLDRMQFQAHFFVDPLNILVCGVLGLFLTPTPLGPKKAKKGDFGGCFWPRTPLFAPLWPCFGPIFGSKWPNFGSVEPRSG